MLPLTFTAEASQRSAEQRSLHVHVALAPSTCRACMHASIEAKSATSEKLTSMP